MFTRVCFRGRGKSQAFPRKSDDSRIVEKAAMRIADLSALCVHAANAALLMKSAWPTLTGSRPDPGYLARLNRSAYRWREPLS